MLSSRDRNDRVASIIKHKRVLGVVRADINALEFVGGRQKDPKIVDNLKEHFQRARCRRFIPDNYIPVLITITELRKALRASGLNEQAFQTPAKDGSFFLKTAPRQNLKCLEGRHRIEAAKQILPPGDHWWTFKLLLLLPHGEFPQLYSEIYTL